MYSVEGGTNKTCSTELQKANHLPLLGVVHFWVVLMQTLSFGNLTYVNVTSKSLEKDHGHEGSQSAKQTKHKQTFYSQEKKKKNHIVEHSAGLFQKHFKQR